MALGPWITLYLKVALLSYACHKSPFVTEGYLCKVHITYNEREPSVPGTLSSASHQSPGRCERIYFPDG